MSVFITRGMRLSIPPGGLKIAPTSTGDSTASVAIQVGITLFPIWLEIAFRHLQKAHSANAELLNANAQNNSGAIAEELEEEFTHGMQSITASATAIDAFYASMKGFAKFSKEETVAMQSAKTSRPARIKETLRRVFSLKPAAAAQLGSILTSIYRLRDLSVHPAAGQHDPVLHSVLKVGVEWRFVAFSHSNAHEILRGSLSLLLQLLQKGSVGEGPLKNECAEFLPLLSPVLADWEKTFGSIRAVANSTDVNRP